MMACLVIFLLSHAITSIMYYRQQQQHQDGSERQRADQTADFSELLRQLKQKQDGSDTEEIIPAVISGERINLFFYVDFFFCAGCLMYINAM